MIHVDEPNAAWWPVIVYLAVALACVMLIWRMH